LPARESANVDLKARAHRETGAQVPSFEWRIIRKAPKFVPLETDFAIPATRLGKIRPIA